MKKVFSGIQPSGNLHLGNYLGAIHNWIALQNNHHAIFGIMDLHAITLPQDSRTLEKSVLDCAITYLASGLNPEKATIFIQSSVAEHTELAWILGCITPLGWLNRMTQFKEKSAANENLGLYAYPVLMAADILLYQADLVPVGDDQKQHLELARDLAGAFNRRYNCDFFQLPEPMIIGNATRVMSLQDGTKKMSKSDSSDLSRINLTDDADSIRKKIKKCKTDSHLGLVYDPSRPEICNLLNIFAACTNQKPDDIALNYTNSGFGKFKEDLAEAIVAKIDPIQQEIIRWQRDLSEVKNILRNGRKRALEIAASNIKAIKEIAGLYNF